MLAFVFLRSEVSLDLITPLCILRESVGGILSWFMPPPVLPIVFEHRLELGEFKIDKKSIFPLAFTSSAPPGLFAVYLFTSVPPPRFCAQPTDPAATVTRYILRRQELV